MRRYIGLLLIMVVLTAPFVVPAQDIGDRSISIGSQILNEEELINYLAWWQTNMDSLSSEDEIIVLNKAQAAAQDLGLDSLNCLAHYELGLLSLYEGLIPSAFSHLEAALSFRGKINNTILFAWSNNALGVINIDVGEREEALSAFFTSLEDFLELNSVYGTYPLGNISDVYQSLGDTEKAIKYTLEAVKYTKQLDGHHYAYNYGYDCTKLSGMYDVLGEVDSASIYLERSLGQVEGLDLSYEHSLQAMYDIYKNAFFYYLKRGKYEKAKRYMSLAVEAFPDKTNIAVRMIQGSYYLATNQKELLFESFKNDTIGIADSNIREEYLKLKKKAYQKHGYFQSALEVADALEQIKQEQHNSEKEKFEVFADAKFENLKKEKKINELEKERSLNKLTIQKQEAKQLAGLTGIALILMVAFFIYYRFLQKSRFSKKLQLEVEQKTKTLQVVNSDLATKNIELKRFNHIVSHDLKEPLRSIVSFSNILQQTSKENPTVQEYTGYIINSGKQLYSLIEDIIKFQEFDQMNFRLEEVNLSEVLNNVTVSLSNYITDRNAVVQYEQLPTIKHSSSALFLIFKNLIENGIKYNKQQIPLIEISSQEIEGNIHLSFKDNGIGIEQNYFDQVFIMFKRLHARTEYQGSGIGLAFSQKVAKQMKSSIVISKSEINGGTTFTLIITPAELATLEAVGDSKQLLASAKT